jgi:L-asparaginase
VPEVTIFFADLLFRGNRAVNMHADSYRGFASPNHPPLATAGVSIEFESTLIRGLEPRPDPAAWPDQRGRDGVAAPSGLDGHVLRTVLARPGLRGFDLEA